MYTYLGVDIVGLQETKISNPSDRRVKSIGGSKIPHWCVLDSIETRGGAMVGWSDSFALIDLYVGIFSVSV